MPTLGGTWDSESLLGRALSLSGSRVHARSPRPQMWNSGCFVLEFQPHPPPHSCIPTYSKLLQMIPRKGQKVAPQVSRVDDLTWSARLSSSEDPLGSASLPPRCPALAPPPTSAAGRTKPATPMLLLLPGGWERTRQPSPPLSPAGLGVRRPCVASPAPPQALWGQRGCTEIYGDGAPVPYKGEPATVGVRFRYIFSLRNMLYCCTLW